MAGTIDLCMTDANGYGVFDYRFLNSIGNGQDIKVWSVQDMINKAIAAASQPGARIKNLYINGHGAPGIQSVGLGKQSVDKDPTGERSLQLDPDWYGQLLGVTAWAGLGLLTDYMADDAMVTLSGCEVAAGGNGKALLRAIAAVIGTWVQACDAKQYAWIPGWEGNLYKCSPDGDILSPDGSYM